jgi:hypothetical protein
MNRLIFIFFVLSFFATCLVAQTKYIKGVPDYNQPPTQTLPSTISAFNYCAPFAALNVMAYWDSTVQFPLSKNLLSGIPPSEAAEYLGWFMDTNDFGSPSRSNGITNPPAQGTYAVDQWAGIFEYMAFDTTNSFGFPFTVPQNKQGYFWDILPDYMPNFFTYVAEIDSGKPVKLDFLHWNIINTGYTFFDPAISDDPIYIYRWDVIADTSGLQNPEDPSEKWNLETGEANIGHAVTGVGYMLNYSPNDTLFPPEDYVIVHDNWRTTSRDIAIPWQYTTALMIFNPPPHPDLTVTHIRTSNDTSSGYSDSLALFAPVHVASTVDDLKFLGVPAFTLITGALDSDGNLLNEDTVHFQIAINKVLQSDTFVVHFDSLFTPIQNGIYTIYSQVYWDYNNDKKINDPPDADPGNDYQSVNRFVGYNVVYTKIYLVPGVPDINQPPTLTLPSTMPFNYCAPIAAANILLFLDNVLRDVGAIDVTAGLAGETLAEYIGWFMDTNDQGNPAGYNGTIYQSSSGTYVIDQDSLLREYVRWDTAHTQAVAPNLPPNKIGYDWLYESDYSQGSSFYEMVINAGRPAKLDFTHWNISFSGTIFVDSLEKNPPDTVYLYQWGTPVGNSTAVDSLAPIETWNFEEGLENIGHAVTGVGYLNYGQTNPFHAIVHDNWPTTERDIAIPWGSYWHATLVMEPMIIPGIEQERQFISTFELHQNYPNPFNSFTLIPFELPQQSDVTLTIFNSAGQKISTQFMANQKPGVHRLIWNASNLSSGIYFFRIQAGKWMQVKKALLIR